MASKPGKYGIESAIASSAILPAYSKTLRNLRSVVHPEVELDKGAFRFTRYPFEPAAVFPAGMVDVDRIAEINLGCPSQIRLKGGDILFVPAPGKEALVTFLNHNDIRIVDRFSVWQSLLDPFLDTWEDQETIDRQFDWFATLGLDREAVNAWRREVAAAMVAYNFGTNLWEWNSLDLYDVLVAQRAHLNQRAFSDFYSRAMDLAAIDPLSPGYGLHGDTTIESALFSVLIEWYPRDKSGDIKNVSEQSKARNNKIDELHRKLTAELTSAYSEPHRHYHTLSHVEKCLRELNHVWQYAIRLNEVRWAILFHDAVYDPRGQDNEACSADWACRLMDELQRPEDEKARVRGMIMATRHSGRPATPDEALLLDLDLSILGSDETTFNEYDRSIRSEYQWVPEQSYRQARSEILKSFVNRERLFYTAPLHRCYEESARENIQRALQRHSDRQAPSP